MPLTTVCGGETSDPEKNAPSNTSPGAEEDQTLVRMIQNPPRGARRGPPEGIGFDDIPQSDDEASEESSSITAAASAWSPTAVPSDKDVAAKALSNFELLNESLCDKEVEEDREVGGVAANALSNFEFLSESLCEKEEEDVREVGGGRRKKSAENPGKKFADDVIDLDTYICRKEEEERLALESRRRRKEEERLANEATRRREEDERLAAEDKRRREEQERLALEARRRREEEESQAVMKAEEERLATKKVEEETLLEILATKKAEEEMLATKKAEEERLAMNKVEEERLLEMLATKKVEEEMLATKKAEEEMLATKKVEEERLAAVKSREEMLGGKKEQDECTEWVQEEENDRREYTSESRESDGQKRSKTTKRRMRVENEVPSRKKSKDDYEAWGKLIRGKQFWMLRGELRQPNKIAFTGKDGKLDGYLSIYRYRLEGSGGYACGFTALREQVWITKERGGGSKQVKHVPRNTFMRFREGERIYIEPQRLGGSEVDAHNGKKWWKEPRAGSEDAVTIHMW